MALAYLLDENVPGRLRNAIRRHNTAGSLPLDVVHVGEFDDLPFSSDDPSILRWAERAGRILVSEDKQTLPMHLQNHLQAGHHSPGIFLIRPGTGILDVLDHLVLAAYASEPHE